MTPAGRGQGELERALRDLEGDQRRIDLLAGELVVNRLGSDSDFYAACTSDGYWALAIASVTGSAPQAPVRLESFAAEFGVHYVLQQGDERERVRVCVLQCLSDRRDIRALFLVVCDAVMEHISGNVSDAAVASAINSWLGLFRKLQLPSRATVVGLIGELTFINACHDTESAVRAWHSDVTSTIDFVFSDPVVEIEVKATTGARRAHSVSLQQALRAPDVRRFFASVLVDLRSSGSDVASLVESITTKLRSQDGVLLFWRGLTDTCGEQLDSFLAQRFLSDAAAASVGMYASESIPQPQIELPLESGVTEIRFRSDFSSSETVPMDVVFRKSLTPADN